MKGSFYYSLFMTVVFAFLGIILTLTADTLWMQYFYAAFYTFVTLYFGVITARKYKRFHRDDYVGKAQKIRRQANYRYIYEHEQALEELRAIQAQCPFNSFEHSMVGLDVMMAGWERDSAIANKLPYAPPELLDEALTTLDLMRHKTSLDDDKIRDAADTVRRKNNLHALKRRKAPKAVIATAERRLAEADKAERLLLNRPKNFTW